MGLKPRKRARRRLRFDRTRLYKALEAKRSELDCSWPEVARQAGITDMTLVRLRRDQGPTLDSYAALVAWLGVGAETFFK
jgi:transcriptional regulator with XRE-family HTH domain